MAVRNNRPKIEPVDQPDVYDPEEPVYVRNERGAVQSVTREHFDTYLTQVSQDTGLRYPLPGWEVVDEEEAREENPQLFGAHDPRISYTAAELTQQYQQRQMLEELYGKEQARKGSAEKE